ncbi:MAG: hypothetical protein Q9160_008863 [Pyrenula sp. 1 TL-2023]
MEESEPQLLVSDLHQASHPNTINDTEANETQSPMNQPQASAPGRSSPSPSSSTAAGSHGSSNMLASAEVDNSKSVKPTKPFHSFKKPNSTAIKLREALGCIHAIFHNLKRLANEVTWLKEFLSLVVALIALAFIVMVLALHQDKTLPKWPSSISINSLVSILTSILKAAMMLPIAEGISELKWMWFSASHPLSDLDRYDAASRGPLGSLGLLKNYRNLLPCLGAVVTIIALAIDPFTQQILQYYNCLEPKEGFSATIPRADSYAAAKPWIIGLDSVSNALDGPMTASLFQGLINPPANSTASIPINCQSGNCSFPLTDGIAYRSLGVCSTVDDISHTINTTGGEGSLSNFATRWSLDAFGLATEIHAKALLVIADAVQDPNDLNTTERRPLSDIKGLIVNDRCPNSMDRGCASPWAFSAQLYPCVRAYGDVHVSNSVLQEHIVSAMAIPYKNFTNLSGGYSLAGNYPSLPGIDCTPSSGRQGNKATATGLYQSGLRYVVDEYDNTSDTDPNTLWYDPACTYDVGSATNYAFWTYIASFFGSTDEPAFFGPVLSSRQFGSTDAWLERLYADGASNLTVTKAYFEGLANALTQVIRQQGDPQTGNPAVGTALINQTCIRVQWAWLTLPIALLFSTFVFFIGMVVQSRKYTRKGAVKGRRKVWKSSALPLLWCGLDHETRKRYGGFNDLQTMKESSDKLKNCLVQRNEEGDHRGWKLTEQ